MTTETTTGKRPGGRSAAVLVAVKRALEDLMAERGSDRVTIPMVAERAGVNPTSVYRRWGDLPSMINDIATYRLDPNRPMADTGDLREDLTSWTAEFVRHYSIPANAALLRAGAATAGETETDCLRNRRAEAGVILDRFGGDGPVSAEDIIDHVIAPIVYRVIYQPHTLSDATAPKLVNFLMGTR
ncbi:TetR/AcrR family transcriptional regulator [Glaciihabitans sp. dw_435]|uniref:TetR/AcrR family transcriptional regulator n=1 Tax=Glaciihabitans sp. dw_435 TaxID=2720081 RepID=UPI001BD4AA7E|nr:TetR/AcrR family transcriptional regulator [Glaciihabitans sp. dw_435]